MEEKINNDVQPVVCPEGYEFVRPHTKGGKLIIGYCRKSNKQKQKDLATETIDAIPFGFDAVVAYDYLKYGKGKISKKEKKK